MNVTLYVLLDMLSLLCHAVGFTAGLLICLIIGYNIGLWVKQKFKGEDDESEQ